MVAPQWRDFVSPSSLVQTVHRYRSGRSDMDGTDIQVGRGLVATATGERTATMKITAQTNGPLLVRGQVEIVDQNGNAYTPQSSKMLALCRCGGSVKKPFCDGSHAKNGFLCPAQPE